MPRPTFPTPAALDRATARLWTDWLWRHGEPNCIDAEDVCVFRAIHACLDGKYLSAAQYLDRAEDHKQRLKGLEE